MMGLGNENLENLRLESWNFGQNKAEKKWKCKIFLKIENEGGGHMSGALMVIW